MAEADPISPTIFENLTAHITVQLLLKNIPYSSKTLYLYLTSILCMTYLISVHFKSYPYKNINWLYYNSQNLKQETSYGEYCSHFLILFSFQSNFPLTLSDKVYVRGMLVIMFNHLIEVSDLSSQSLATQLIGLLCYDFYLK